MNRKILLTCTLSLATVASLAMADFGPGHDRQGRDYDRGFGMPGSNGASAATGTNGSSYVDANGQPIQETITIPAGGTLQPFSFAGGAGTAGGPGNDGTPADDCYVGAPRYNTNENVRGADGGSGSDAGVGGNGGNGANVTVIYTPPKAPVCPPNAECAAPNPLTDLKTVNINLSGGAAGPTGNYAGQGQEGCQCDGPTQWSFPVTVMQQQCTNGGGAPTAGNAPPPHPGPGPDPRPNPPGPNPDPNKPNPPTPVTPTPPPAPVCRQVPVTTYVTHFCWGGDSGSNGTYPAATAGQTGSVTLIPSNAPTTTASPSAAVQVSSLPFSGSVTYDNYVTETGAAALFAPGSVVADQYTMFTGRTTTPYRIVWGETTLSNTDSTVASAQFGVSIQNGQPISLTWDTSQLWVAYTQAQDASGNTVFTIEHAITPANASAITTPNVTISGTGTATNIVINDPAGASEIVGTTAVAVIKSQGIFLHQNQKITTVPQQYIQVVGPGQILIHIGQYYPSGNMGDLNAGKDVTLALTLTRTMNGGTPAESLTESQINYEIKKLQ